MSVSVWQFLGFAVTSLLGTVLHFLYDLTGENKIAALFSGVNESTWEHMKLMFFPMLLFAFVQSFFFKEKSDFWCVKLKGILLGIGLIPVIFYTYNGVIGKSPDFVNITIFFVCAAIAYIYEAKELKKGTLKCSDSKIPIFILILIAILFFVFTFYPPQLELFRAPIG